MTVPARVADPGGGEAVPGPDATELDRLVGRLGVRVRARPGDGRGDADPIALLGVAVRRNPRRTHLLVSRVLGKHVPTDPRLVRAAGLLLGARVAEALAGDARRALPVELLHAAARGDRSAAAALHRHAVVAVPRTAADAVVLGFAETATALGHCVAEGLGGSHYLHSTRRAVVGSRSVGGFTEEHSHAAEHLLLPADPAPLRDGRPLVLVDDELSTGRTALNTITALHRQAPRSRYVVAALVDVRGADDGLAAGVRALGARLDVVALASGTVELPTDLAARAAALREAVDREAGDREAGDRRSDGAEPRPAVTPRVRLRDCGWPDGLPTGGRHGFDRAAHRALDAALPGLAASLVRAAGLTAGDRTLVLGTEELMQLPLRLAEALALAGHDVRFSTTTRSPAVVADAAGYALASGCTFPAHDDPSDGPGPRYAYNLGRAGDPPWDHVLVVVDPPADTPLLPTGLLAAVARRARRTTVVRTP